VAEIELMRRVLASNDALAARQLAALDRHRVFGINLMSGPGSGKTTLIEKTVEALLGRYRIHVIEGDIQGDLDARRVAAKGAACTQLNTQGACHLDAMMVQSALDGLELGGLDLLIIENVGNLVCPAEFAMPAHAAVTLLSTAEGSDKPVKYPLMFQKSDAVVITKTDLGPHVDFDPDAVEAAVHKLKPAVPVFRVSARTGDGLGAWLGWVEQGIRSRKQ
jgi:hydrogenase nickel incorporation protein HypB